MIHNLVLKAVRSDGLIFHYESDDWRTTSVTGIDAAEIEVSKEARGVGDYHGKAQTSERDNYYCTGTESRG